MKLEKINLGILWAMLAGTATAVIWMFTTFATAADLQELKKDINGDLEKINISIAYGQYYDRLDDFDEATEEGNEDLAEEYARQMEKLKASICEVDSAWERCSL